MNMNTMHIIIGSVALVAGIVVQSKFSVIEKIGNAVGMVPVIGDKLEDIVELLE